MAKDAPADVGAGQDVVFDDSVEEGGFAGVGDAVDEAVLMGFEGWVEGREFGGVGLFFGEDGEGFQGVLRGRGWGGGYVGEAKAAEFGAAG